MNPTLRLAAFVIAILAAPLSALAGGPPRPAADAEPGVVSGGAEPPTLSHDPGETAPASAATPAPAKARRGAWYVSWGYNTEGYARTDIRFAQPARGNDFTLEGVQLHDAQGWDLWNHALTVPQYSFRLGKFITKNTAIELNFDHAKAVATPDHDQAVRMRGTIAGAAVDKEVKLSDVVQKYKLNNGANFVLVNVVRRFLLVREPGATGSVALLGKAGVGFTVPHTENTVLGEANDEGFQFGGPGAGVEGALRVHIFRNLYGEASQKGFYGRYRNLNIRDGKAGHGLWAYVTILDLGVSF